MRVVGTALICIVAAFGAAFLVARAVKHPTPAHAATTPRTTRVAATVPKSATARRANAELVAQFSPVPTSTLKHRPKPRRRHHATPSAAPAPTTVTSSAPTVTTPAPTVTSTPVYSAPVQSAPSPQPSGSSSGSSAPKKKKSSGGSGTTTIGG